MASVFGTTQAHKGTFRAEDLKMTFAGNDGDGMLVQQANFTVTRNVNMMYEIGSSNVYYVGDRRNGQAQLSRIVGGSATFRQLVSNYSNLCQPRDLSLAANGSCPGANAVLAGGGVSVGVTYNLKFATLTSIGASVQAEQIIVSENLGFLCSDIEFA